ncbi:MAG: AraC family transcriptional regulator [Glaciecola sp.]
MSNASIEDTLNIGPNCYERFISQAKLAEIEALDLQLAGCSNLSGGYCVGRTYPLEHTLFYTISGHGRLLTNNGEYPLGPNSLAILPAKQGFQVSIGESSNTDNTWDIIWLNLGNTEHWRYLLNQPARVLENQHLAPLHHAMEVLFYEESPELCKALTPIITQYVHRALQYKQSTVLVSEAATRVLRLFATVEKRLQFDWDVQAMCDHVHYSAPHLHRLCLAQFGKSPMQQLIHLRISRAKHLLNSTNWPVQHIASYVGYQNIFNFSKRFKQVVGIAPSKYRKGDTNKKRGVTPL